MSKLTNTDLIEALEQAAALLPWDRVDLTMKREPDGRATFSFYVPQNEQFGFPSIFSYGDTPQGALAHLQEQDEFLKRDPEQCRQEAIAKLEKKIADLRNLVISVPPYRPGFYLVQNNPQHHSTEIQSEVTHAS